MATEANSRTYVGRLEAGSQAVYVVSSEGVERLPAPRGDCGWGSGSRARDSELARLMLADASGCEPGAEACSRFTRQILSRLPDDGFALQGETISAWLSRVVPVP